MTFVYSETIFRFIEKIERQIRLILNNEVRLICRGNRFYNRTQTASYPICVVIYNHKSMLGYFDASFYELGFHERLMHVSEDQLHNIIRHEIAHYIAFINHGASIQPHAAEFQAICKRFGWDESVSKASMAIDESSAEESGVLRKVKKLMALTSSSHANEAEQAMIKAQQLLVKHHVECTETEEKIAMQRVLEAKKESAKMRAIAAILKTFFVSVVYRKGQQRTALEIVGSAVNVAIAEHVAHVLDLELDNLWDKAKKSASLKGTVAKNSFFLGVAKGYCNKIEALKKAHSQDVTKALIVVEKQLIYAQDMIYRRLSSRKASTNYCPKSGSLGEKMGKGLTINPAISEALDSKKLLCS